MALKNRPPSRIVHPAAPELDEEQVARKAHLLSSFQVFARESGMLPDYAAQPHDEMCDEMAESFPEIGTGKTQKKAIYLAPRYTFKTSLLACAMVYEILWWRERGVDIAIDYVRAMADLAKDVLYEIKMELESNPTILELFGSLREQANIWTEGKINLGKRRDFTLNTAGLDFGGAGKHPDWVVLDDIVNEKNFDSQRAKRAARVKIQAYYPILPPWGSMLETGTRFAPQDVHGWLLEQNARDAKEHRRLLAMGELDAASKVKPQWREYIRAVRDANGNLFFPTRLTEEFLEQQKRSIESKFYAAWYLNSPVAEGMNLFRLEYLSYFTARYTRWPIPVLEVLRDDGTTLREIPVRVTMTIDPTLTAQARSDWTGVSVVATDIDGNWWVLVAHRMLEVPSVVGDRCLDFIRRFQPVQVRIEQGGDAEMISRISRAVAIENIPTVIGGYAPQRDETHGSGRRKKSARIEALEPRFRNGQIRLHRGACEALYDQYKNWPDLEHDDVFDALAMQVGISKRCAYRTVDEAAVDILADEDLEEPGQMYAPYREEVAGGRFAGRSGLGAQRLW